jgi:FAD dependent oxidoreductase TIGR03364
MTSASSTASRHADVIVIGAGILGTFHAYFAALKGYKTVLIERNPWPNDASTRNFGMVVQTIVETDSAWADYARASRDIYLTLQAEHDLNVRRTGSLYLASTDAERAVLEEFARAFASSYHCAYLPADEARQSYPFIQPDYCAGALFFPDDLTVEPRRLLRLLIPHLVEQGLIEYLPQTTIVAVEPDGQGGRITDDKGNTFTADHIFVCSGADYRTLFPERFQASGLKVCKLQMMQTVPQRQTLPHSILSGLSIQRYPAFKSAPSYPLLAEQPVDQRLRDYGVHLLFKQAIDGSIIIGDSHEYSNFDEATSGEERTNCLINDAVLEYGQRMIHLPSWQIQHLWNGYYLLHPERQVYTEAITDAIHIVTGIAGKGMSTGPGFSQQHIAAVLG